ncbi:MAG: class I mannose-6-phosphate isomerase [Sphingomicrobium sp.]
MFDVPGGESSGERIGEVWFTGGAELPLLAKYIFTSERLSIQVHPDDAQARERGLAQGKSECWTILDAEPGATLGLGLTREVGAEELRGAALDGSIEQLMAWRPVSAGDFVFVPSGTIHAIGAGISLLEFQQNADVTYRLYDYGRPRELHLDDAIAVAAAQPFDGGLVQHLSGSEQRTLVDGPHFTLVRTNQDALEGRQRWIMPLDGEVYSAGATAGPGDCLLVAPDERVETSGAQMLVGATSRPS